MDIENTDENSEEGELELLESCFNRKARRPTQEFDLDDNHHERSIIPIEASQNGNLSIYTSDQIKNKHRKSMKKELIASLVYEE